MSTEFGDPRLPARFWAKIDVAPNGCWLWQASRLPTGYGLFYMRRAGSKTTHSAHRFAYQHLVGLIPAGLTCDHLCRVRECCNPAHLELVTQSENTARGYGGAWHNRVKTACKRGHPFTPENTIRKANGGRQCRTCANAQTRARRYADPEYGKSRGARRVG